MRALLLAVLLAGCATPTPEATYAVVDPPPDGGGFAECPPRASVPLAIPFRSEVTEDAGGRGAGIHRLDERAFLWVFASYEGTLREDRVSRVNEVNVSRAGDGRLHVCTRVELLTPIEVDRDPRSYDVAVRLFARDGLPDGAARVVVNWVAGCPCETSPTGNATALFE